MHTHESLIVVPGLVWPVDPVLEASGTGPARQVQKSGRAGAEVLKDRNALERDTTKQLLIRLGTLKQSLQKRLLADTGSLTDFRRFNLQALLTDVDRLIADATAALATQAERVYATAADLGRANAEQPLKAANLAVEPGLPGLDRQLVDAAFGNTVDLLTPPMQQFGADVKQALRGVSLAGDGRMEAIQRLRDKIEGQGFDNAQYRAERIIRTELGRTFNAATFERLVDLAKSFPFLKKGWRATNDRRTRMGHREAGQKYQRGAGTIPIAQSFSVTVYDERPGKAPVKMGIALLRFPVDPQTVPQGRIAAAATIMCRCNGFVDYDLAEYAAHVKTRLQVALPGQAPTTAVPKTPPKPKTPRMPKPAKVTDPDKALGQSLQTGSTRLNHYKGAYYMTQGDALRVAGQLTKKAGVSIVKGSRGFYIQDAEGNRFGPQGWTRQTTVKVPKAADVTPKPAAAAPSGPAVSAALQVEAGFERVSQALKVLDSVHGDGALPTGVPTGQMPKRFRAKAAAGYLAGQTSGKALGVYFTKKILKGAPNMSVFHEVGHFLDHKGIGGAIDPSGLRFGSDLAGAGGPVADAVAKLQAVLKGSKAMQTLKVWYEANLPPVGYHGQVQNPGGHTYGDGTVPLGVHRKMVTYLLSTHESFARAYAQYVTVKSGNAAALKELRNLQASSATGLQPVPRTAPFNANQTSAAAPKPGSWDYPWQWQDDDFKPIEAAMDHLMDVLGWRTKQ